MLLEREIGLKIQIWPRVPYVKLVLYDAPCTLSRNVRKRNPLQVAGQALHVVILDCCLQWSQKDVVVTFCNLHWFEKVSVIVVACEQPLRNVFMLMSLYVGPVSTPLKKCFQRTSFAQDGQM